MCNVKQPDTRKLKKEHITILHIFKRDDQNIWGTLNWTTYICENFLSIAVYSYFFCFHGIHFQQKPTRVFPSFRGCYPTEPDSAEAQSFVQCQQYTHLKYQRVTCGNWIWVGRITILFNHSSKTQLTIHIFWFENIKSTFTYCQIPEGVSYFQSIFSQNLIGQKLLRSWKTNLSS